VLFWCHGETFPVNASFLLPIHHPSTVWMEDLSGHIRGIVRGKENEGGRDFVWLTGTAKRSVGAKSRHLFRRKRRRNQGSPDRTGRDRVHPNPFFRERLRQRTSESDDRAFRRGIIEQLWTAPVDGDRCGVDDHAAPLEMRHDCL